MSYDLSRTIHISPTPTPKEILELREKMDLNPGHLVSDMEINLSREREKQNQLADRLFV